MSHYRQRFIVIGVICYCKRYRWVWEKVSGQAEGVRKQVSLKNRSPVSFTDPLRHTRKPRKDKSKTRAATTRWHEAIITSAGPRRASLFKFNYECQACRSRLVLCSCPLVSFDLSISLSNEINYSLKCFLACDHLLHFPIWQRTCSAARTGRFLEQRSVLPGRFAQGRASWAKRARSPILPLPSPQSERVKDFQHQFPSGQIRISSNYTLR